MLFVQPGFPIDPYSSLCQGNLAYLQSDTIDDKEWERLIRVAFNSYKAVLKVRVGKAHYCVCFAAVRGDHDRCRGLLMWLSFLVYPQLRSSNVFAANGLGIVLSERGQLEEAKTVFAAIREAAPDVSPVVLNLAHSMVRAVNWSVFVGHASFMRGLVAWLCFQWSLYDRLWCTF